LLVLGLVPGLVPELPRLGLPPLGRRLLGRRPFGRQLLGRRLLGWEPKLLGPMQSRELKPSGSQRPRGPPGLRRSLEPPGPRPMKLCPQLPGPSSRPPVHGQPPEH